MMKSNFAGSMNKCVMAGLLLLATSAHAADVIASCDVDAMAKIEHRGITNLESSEACRTMASSLGRQPSAQLAGTMFKMLFGFKYVGYTAPSKDIAYQVMNVIEARGQVNKPDEAMIKSMNAVFKCYQGSEGHVTPRDFAIALRAMSPKQAAGLSDDFMYTLGAMIQEDKKKRGE